MIDRRYIELMNAEIDGVNTPEASRELNEYLNSDPEARRHLEELKDVGRVLSDAEPVSPPVALRAAIMSDVAARNSRTAGSGLLDSVRVAISPVPRLRPALAFTGGVAVGLGIFVLLSVTLPQFVPGDAADLYGTVGGERCFVAAEPVAFDVPGISGRASVRYCAENVTLELNLSSESEVTVVLSYGEGVDFDGLRALQAGDHALRVTGHRAELTHAGRRDYDLRFIDHSESRMPIRMSVLEAGRTVFESSVPPGRE